MGLRLSCQPPLENLELDVMGIENGIYAQHVKHALCHSAAALPQLGFFIAKLRYVLLSD